MVNGVPEGGEPCLTAGYARLAGDLAGTVEATLVVARIQGYAPPSCACLAVVRATTRVAPTVARPGECLIPNS